MKQIFLLISTLASLCCLAQEAVGGSEGIKTKFLTVTSNAGTGNRIVLATPTGQSTTLTNGTDGQLLGMSGSSLAFITPFTLDNILTNGNSSTSTSSTTYKMRLGNMVHQAFGTGNAYVGNNSYYNGTNWITLSADYSAGMQFYNGQLLLNAFNTAASGATVTPVYPFKADYNGNVALGGNVSSTLGTFTGAKVLIKSTGIVNISNVPTYADNAAATAGGLVAGDVYKTSTGQLMIRY